MPPRTLPIACVDCGVAFETTIRHRGRGCCHACYLWHLRHGWDRPRAFPPPACVVCGVAFGPTIRHRGHGRCAACKQRAWRARQKEMRHA